MGIGGRSGAAAPLLIALVAAGCGVWAVVDLVAAARPDASGPVVVATSAATPAGGRPVALHTLLADGDGLDDVGALVNLDGTVVGEPDSRGFWVRDLRDNVVYVASGARPRAGASVRVVGRLERVGVSRRAPRVPAGALVEDVRVAAGGPAAVEVLGD